MSEPPTLGEIEVDQSGKIGDTQVPTVLAFSDGIERAILIPATVKRKCVRALRQRGETGRTLYWKLFAAGLFLLLCDHIEKTEQVTVDIEYPGHEGEIKRLLLQLCHRHGLFVPTGRIHFALVGKKSPAHRVAIQTFRGQRQPDRVVTSDDLLGLLDKQRDRGRPTAGKTS